METQGLKQYNDFNDKLLEIIGEKNQHRPGPLDPEAADLVYRTLYDLDNFKLHVTRSAIREELSLPPETWERAMADDAVLLEVGMKWINYRLFTAA